MSELPHPVHIPPSKLLRHESLLKSTSTHGGSVKDDTWFTSRAELLAPNVLNKRSGTNNPSLSSRSALNVRYIEAAKQAEHSYVPPPPPVGAPPVGGVQRHASNNNGLPLAGPMRSRDESYSSTSTTPVMKSNAPAIFSVSVDETRSGDYATSPITIEDSVGGGGNVPLSKDSRMNDRYTKHVVVDPSRMGLLAGDSKLNQRYAQKGIAVNGDGNTRAPVQNGNAAPPYGGKQGRYMKNPKAVNGGKKSGGGGGGSSLDVEMFAGVLFWSVTGSSVMGVDDAMTSPGLNGRRSDGTSSLCVSTSDTSECRITSHLIVVLHKNPCTAVCQSLIKRVTTSER